MAKKKEVVSNSDIAPVSDTPSADFFERVAGVIEQARKFVGRTADLTMTVTYFAVGQMIVEREQGGKERAEYGAKLLPELSEFLTKRFKNGFSVSTLTNARKFYISYTKQVQTSEPAISQTLFTKLAVQSKDAISQTLSTEFMSHETMQAATKYFKLSWSHYLVLMRIEDKAQRNFYEIEAAKRDWTVRQLNREYASSLYERLALSRNKDEVMRLSTEGQTLEKPRDILKNPLVLEFLGLEEKPSYSESDLENAIIGKLTNFLYELGMGFMFDSRQRRFTFNEKHFFVDLVFYNRELQCYVLIDLKVDSLKHQDLGQMLMYVNYFDRIIKKDYEKPTIGLLLCRDKDDSIVELTLPENSNIYAAEYSLYLPDKSLLQSKLAEWIQEFEDEHGTDDKKKK